MGCSECGFYEKRGISWPAENLLASQEGLLYGFSRRIFIVSNRINSPSFCDKQRQIDKRGLQFGKWRPFCIYRIVVCLNKFTYGELGRCWWCTVRVTADWNICDFVTSCRLLWIWVNYPYSIEWMEMFLSVTVFSMMVSELYGKCR